LFAHRFVCVVDAFGEFWSRSNGRDQPHCFGICDADRVVTTVTAAEAAGELRVMFGLCEQRFDRLVDPSRLIRWRRTLAAM
jgi:hypothetical protein